MVAPSIQVLKTLKNDRHGNVSIITGFIIVSLLGLMGGGVDLVRYSTYASELQAANDSAILAASKLIGASTEVQREIAYDYLDINLADSVSGLTVTYREYLGPADCVAENPAAGSAPTSCLDITAEMNTYFMKFFNVPKLNVVASSQASIQMRPMEISFGFDATGSMQFGNRWEDATSALSNMLDVLKQAADADGGDNFRASLVPYTDRVKIPAWLEAAVLDPGIPVDTSGNNNPYSKNREAYVGCVEMREEDGTMYEADGTPVVTPFLLTDEPPGAGMYFAPSQKDNFGPIYHSYTKAPICLKEYMVPVTSDIDAIQQELDALNPKGTGRFDVGAAWVWRTLSPKWRGVFGDPDWPRDATNADGDENVKVAVIITDGNTVAYEDEVQWEVDGGSWPSPPYEPWGNNNGSPEGFAHFADLCNRMTADGIHVHMVFVAKNGVNANFLPYAEQCASQPDYFHNVDDADDLIAAFQSIGELTSQLRLTK